jgi:hypothetical protein
MAMGGASGMGIQPVGSVPAAPPHPPPPSNASFATIYFSLIHWNAGLLYVLYFIDILVVTEPQY